MIDAHAVPDIQTDGWLVIWTESRAERRVAARITANGMYSWLPTVVERHRWSDRWKNVTVPLFPGYLFARLRLAEVHRVLRVPGVLTVVKSGEEPAVLSDRFVGSLRRALQTAEAAPVRMTERHDYLVDDEVVVQEGPLAGLRGVVRQFRGGRHLVIWVSDIGRGVAFTIGAALVARCSGPRLGYGGESSDFGLERTA